MKTPANQRKAVQMACLSLNHHEYLLPLDKALKVAELMQSSVECQRHYRDGYTYTCGEQPAVSFEYVKASQIKAPTPGEADQ